MSCDPCQSRAILGIVFEHLLEVSNSVDLNYKRALDEYLSTVFKGLRECECNGDKK